MNTMVLPQNYVELEQEEMMYLDAGWDINTFIRNAIGLSNHQGMHWVGGALAGFAAANRHMKFPQLAAHLAGTAWHAFRYLPLWAQVAVAVSGAGAIYAMGEWALFY